MSQNSDLTLDVSKFNPETVSKKTAALNEDLIAKGKASPSWWEVRYSTLFIHAP